MADVYDAFHERNTYLSRKYHNQQKYQEKYQEEPIDKDTWIKGMQNLMQNSNKIKYLRQKTKNIIVNNKQKKYYQDKKDAKKDLQQFIRNLNNTLKFYLNKK